VYSSKSEIPKMSSLLFDVYSDSIPPLAHSIVSMRRFDLPSELPLVRLLALVSRAILLAFLVLYHGVLA
jgi:hypothetical protein